MAFGWANTLYLYEFDVFGRSNATRHGYAGFSRRGPILKIAGLDTVDDDFDFGMPTPPNRDSFKVELWMIRRRVLSSTITILVTAGNTFFTAC